MTAAMDSVIKRISSPENMDALVKIIDLLPSISRGLELLEELNRKGILESLQDLAVMASSLKDILNDEMLNGTGSLANSLLGLLSAAGSPELMDSLDKVAEGISSGGFARDIHVTGTLSLLRQLKDPDIQKGLAVMLGFLKVLGRA
ncbi:MAG: DUF1641 domain-containing protein [Thermoplasmatales archaeon]